MKQNSTPEARVRGALWGQFVGDALAMPVHWYYNRAALARDYGRVTDFVAPKSPHSDSILWRSEYRALNPKGEILHDQARFWGVPGVHYHQNLAAGENTLNFQLARGLLESLAENGGRYRRDEAIAFYLDFLLTPGRHRDTYVEECHRNFFTRYARGFPPEKCAREDIHIGGLAGLAAIAAAHRDDLPAARQHAVEHLQITHAGRVARQAAECYVELLVRLFAGADLRQEIRRLTTVAGGQKVAWLCDHPLERWLPLADEIVVGEKLSTACYLEEALPAVLYLALKYADDLEGGLIANTNLGGDNCHRGGPLGAILGAALGEAAVPARWRNGLQSHARIQAALDDLLQPAAAVA